jgi:hypothetical protein
MGHFFTDNALRIFDTSSRPKPRQNSSHDRLILGRVCVSHDIHRVVSSQDIEYRQANIPMDGPNPFSLARDALLLKLLPVPVFRSIIALASVPTRASFSDLHLHVQLLLTPVDSYDARNATELSLS